MAWNNNKTAYIQTYIHMYKCMCVRVFRVHIIVMNHQQNSKIFYLFKYNYILYIYVRTLPSGFLSG